MSDGHAGADAHVTPPQKNPKQNRGLPAHLTPGNPGNTGGKKGRSGRPPSKIREMLRGSFEKRVKVLEAIADGEVAYRLRKDGEQPSAADLVKMIPSVADRLKAMDLIAKYGLGTTSTQTDTEGNDAMTLTDAIRAARASASDDE
jgi:hypothetical protein